MDVYDAINNVVHSKDILTYARNINKFCDIALQEKNKKTIVKVFYERVRENGLIGYISFFDTDKYEIFEGPEAVRAFMAVSVPVPTSPVKYLKSLKEFSHGIEEEYCKPVGKHISKKSLLSILKYLDKKYDFCSKIFCDKKAMFLILNVGDRDRDSDCMIYINDDKAIIHFFLYCMTEQTQKEMSPEAVLFHELGHAMHARAFKDISYVPSLYLEVLNKTCFPGISNETAENQNEIFADVLSIGMMYQSPFEKYDPFHKIAKSDKELFQKIFEKVLNSIK